MALGFNFFKLSKKPTAIRDRSGRIVGKCMSEYDEYKYAFRTIIKTVEPGGIDPLCKK